MTDFHKFYNRIEEAHNDFKSLLKSETDPLEEENKPKDLQLEMLLEPEIIIGQTLEPAIVIKQEYEESVVVPPTAATTSKDKPNKNDDVLLSDPEFLDDPNFDDDFGFSCDNSDSNDDMPLIHRFKSDKSTRKSATESISKSNDDNMGKNGDDNDCSESDPCLLQPNGESKKKKSKRKRSSADKCNMSRKSYYTPKTNRLEHDKFLQEHYKITCNKCHLPFDTFPLLCKHYSKEHNERGLVTCCEMKFFDRSLLVDHINFHLNPEYFKCKVCGKVLTQRRCLRAHMKLHEEKQFQCNVCNKKFFQKTILERHKLTHLSQHEKKHPCSECGKL